MEQLDSGHRHSANYPYKDPKKHNLFSGFETGLSTILICTAPHKLENDYGENDDANNEKYKDSNTKLLTVNPLYSPLIIRN
ncbi:MAG TPA: hypothetical protein ENK35_10500 [Candidatus Tenderia sp.]|nr:hypothetical protein [Candidatus Tenderia sp.]